MSTFLVLSTMIATTGLLSDSAAVVIGAMLVAPLMNPVMAAAGAVVMGWPGGPAAVRYYHCHATRSGLSSGTGTGAHPPDLLIALAAGSAVTNTITRKKTAAFVRSQLSLFLVLTIAVSIPLWFYDERILSNARYHAAKSEVLQNWLKASDLELVDIELLTERETIYLALEGSS